MFNRHGKSAVTVILAAAWLLGSSLTGCRQESHVISENKGSAKGSVNGSAVGSVNGSVVTARNAAATAVNLAAFATVTSSNVSGHESLEAINDGFTPHNSRDHSHGCYGNWPERGWQWVEYAWPVAVSTKQVEVYWWDDGRGVRLPKACRIEYWNGSAFVPVRNPAGPSGTPGLGVAPDAFNVTTFDEVATTRIRLSMEGNDTFSTGVIEWRVTDSGTSPQLAPIVRAGPDRVVVTSGETYLRAAVRGMGTVPVLWSKASGPGDVTFADPHAAETTARFSAAGTYVLKIVGGTERTSESALTVTVEDVKPQPRLTDVYTTPYTLNSPLWDARAKALIVNWIPHCVERLSDPNLKEGGIDNFVQAANKLAGKPFKPHQGFPWANAYLHNTVESMCVALQVDAKGDPEILAAQDAMRRKLDEWIPILLAAQEPDGYLQTRITLGTPREQHDYVESRWDPRLRGEHEGYVSGYFIDAAIAHHLATKGKDTRLYDAAKRLADCWCANIGPGKKDWYDGHESIEMALIRLGRYVDEVEGGTKGQKYIQLAKFLLDCRGGGGDYDQSQTTVTRQYLAVGHAVRAAYCYSAMADIAAETGDVDYHSAVKSIWADMVGSKYYVTGGLGSGETSEGFGHGFSLPNNAYCESCAGCGGIFLEHRMNAAYRNARYADLTEETLYNAVLSDVDLAGKNFTYTNSLDTDESRYLWHDCPCCVGNIPRTLLALPTWMYAKDADALYVNLFVGSTVHVGPVAGTDLSVTQETNYPWDGGVALVVNPKQPTAFTLHVRLPNRQPSPLYSSTPEVSGIESLSVNGQPLTAETADGYAVIRRTWAPGDRVTFTIPMTVQRVHADPRVAADRGRVALRYGPLVYNFESVDQPLDRPLAKNSPITPVWAPDLLGGVMTLRGTFADGTPFIAIPNYARNNRGGRSIVWIHEQP
jgi:DUF1680 family protein